MTLSSSTRAFVASLRTPVRDQVIRPAIAATRIDTAKAIPRAGGSVFLEINHINNVAVKIEIATKLDASP
jgi:hypothetical protein